MVVVVGMWFIFFAKWIAAISIVFRPFKVLKFLGLRQNQAINAIDLNSKLQQGKN